MTLKTLIGTLVLALAAAAVALYLLSPASLDEIFRQPWNALLGAPGRINVTLLEVSSNPAPVRAAGWRLLQPPLGMVRFIRSIPPVSTVSDRQEPSQKSPVPSSPNTSAGEPSR